VLAIELLAAAQGLDFRAPLQPSAAVAMAKAELREIVTFYDKDRYFSPDIDNSVNLLCRASFNRLLPQGMLPSF
jgi:histidine ammonia-lyase